MYTGHKNTGRYIHQSAVNTKPTANTIYAMSQNFILRIGSPRIKCARIVTMYSAMKNGNRLVMGAGLIPNVGKSRRAVNGNSLVSVDWVWRMPALELSYASALKRRVSLDL